jgi:hypothetical protein
VVQWTITKNGAKNTVSKFLQTNYYENSEICQAISYYVIKLAESLQCQETFHAFYPVYLILWTENLIVWVRLTFTIQHNCTVPARSHFGIRLRHSVIPSSWIRILSPSESFAWSHLLLAYYSLKTYETNNK